MKKVDLIIVLQCGKSDKICITLKKDMFGCFQNRREQGDDNETGLKEGKK